MEDEKLKMQEDLQQEEKKQQAELQKMEKRVSELGQRAETLRNLLKEKQQQQRLMNHKLN